MEGTSPLNITVTAPILGAPLAPPSREQEAMTDPEELAEGLQIRFSLSATKELVRRIRHRQYALRDWANLAWRTSRFRTLAPEGLLAPEHLADPWRRVGNIFYPHQVETARRVVEEMGGRAILADEVGLGKTIEAGLILKEYLLREQVRRVLILTPAALVWQWYQELKDKFLITASIQRSEYDWERADILIASLDTAKRNPHHEIVHSQTYDLLIVDEAHRVKNRQTANYKFIDGIRKKFCLLLTATPVQNDLRELYNLITLLSPGALGTYTQFRRQHMLDKRTVRRPEELRRRLDGFMVRNRRGPTTVELVGRHVQSIRLPLSDQERSLYDRLAVELAPNASEGGATSLSLITLQREVCSSSYACAYTLEGMRGRTSDENLRSRLTSLLQQATSVTRHSKLERVLELIAQIDDQVIIFTEYKATQQLILARLAQEGIPALGFDGDLSASRKEWSKELFRRYAKVLVSTESGGEGLNFQFCCHVINYDLPWNPMKVEQRIGRVHRLGQTRDVHIWNLATQDTIEEHILFLLYEKIQLFEMAVGELDDILHHVPLERALDEELAQILAEAKSPGEIRERLGELSSRFSHAKTEHERAPSIDSLLDW